MRLGRWGEEGVRWVGDVVYVIWEPSTDCCEANSRYRDCVRYIACIICDTCDTCLSCDSCLSMHALLKKRRMIEGGVLATRRSGDLSGFVHTTESLSYQDIVLSCPVRKVLRTERAIGIS